MQASLGAGIVLLQAEHEAPVTALGVAPDGLSISIGTENGAVGCLDVVSHQYRTLLRSHTDSVHAVAIDPCRCNMLQHERSAQQHHVQYIQHRTPDGTASGAQPLHAVATSAMLLTG